MLIQKPISENDIVSLKLLTGEEIMATYVTDKGDSITVKKPSTIASNGQGMGIVPWMMTSKSETADINKSAIIAMAPTDDEIAKAYTETTSGIKLA
jgi:hypothetical protein